MPTKYNKVVKTGWRLVPSEPRHTDMEMLFGLEDAVFATVDEIIHKLTAKLGTNFSYFIETPDGSKSPITLWINESGEVPHKHCPKLIFEHVTKSVLVPAPIKMA